MNSNRSFSYIDDNRINIYRVSSKRYTHNNLFQINDIDIFNEKQNLWDRVKDYLHSFNCFKSSKKNKICHDSTLIVHNIKPVELISIDKTQSFISEKIKSSICTPCSNIITTKSDNYLLKYYL